MAHATCARLRRRAPGWGDSVEATCARLRRRSPDWGDSAKATCARRLWSYLQRTCFSRACRRAASVAPGIPTDTDSAGRSPFFQLQTLEKCTSHSWLSNYNFSPVFFFFCLKDANPSVYHTYTSCSHNFTDLHIFDLKLKCILLYSIATDDIKLRARFVYKWKRKY